MVDFSITFNVLIVLNFSYQLAIGADVNQTSDEDLQQVKNTIKDLTDKFERWNKLLASSEPQIISTAASLATIDSKIDNLLSKSHVWDTFQLHVTAWNDQLAALDRKANILNRGQEKILTIESKINEAFSKISNIEETQASLKEEIKTQRLRNNQDSLVSEFVTRGVFSTIKSMEKKLDRILLTQQSTVIQNKVNEKSKLTIKCSTSPFVEEMLNDLSAKVDIIFDKVRDKDENDYNNEDYMDDGSGSVQIQIDDENKINKKLLKKINKRCKHILEPVEKILEDVNEIKNISYKLLKRDEIKQVCETTDKTISPMNSCEDLNENEHSSGIYKFNNTSFYCLLRNHQFWTVIQKRQTDVSINFNRSWIDYKNGFGDLQSDFWLGNDLISKLSQEKTLLLRIELEDFKENQAWAEYHKFLLGSEDQMYKISVGFYKGNASDSFSSHNGSLFSTFDRKNDKAPECCPCAVSYGGGWWFNSCFESNLNGPFKKLEDYDGTYSGIIWETWLGNYSLKKSLMMVRGNKNYGIDSVSRWPYYEDP